MMMIEQSFWTIYCFLFFIFQLSDVLGGQLSPTIDLNKTPPVSPHRDLNTDVQESFSVQRETIPVTTADENSLVQANEEIGKSEKQTQAVRKRKKRRANRTYYFPPGTTFDEKRKAYSRMNYLSLVS